MITFLRNMVINVKQIISLFILFTTLTASIILNSKRELLKFSFSLSLSLSPHSSFYSLKFSNFLNKTPPVFFFWTKRTLKIQPSFPSHSSYFSYPIFSLYHYTTFKHIIKKRNYSYCLKIPTIIFPREYKTVIGLWI